MNRLGNHKGFTLIEILVAMTILSIGLLGVAALVVGVIDGNIISNKITTATVLAQEQMEDIQRQGYSGTAATDTTTTEAYNSITNYGAYKRVTVIDVDSPDANMKTITITVYWDSDAYSVALNTILAQ